MLVQNLSRMKFTAEKALSLGTEDARVENIQIANPAKWGDLAQQYC